MDDERDLISDSPYECNVCSLSQSRNPRDIDLLKQLSEDSEFYCLTCKGTANDMKKLCSPAFK